MPPDIGLDLDRLSSTLAAGAVALTGLGSIGCALPPLPRAEAPALASDTLASDTLAPDTVASDAVAALLRRFDPRVCELVVGQLLPVDPIDVPPRLLAQYLDRLDPVQRDVAVGRLKQWRAPAPPRLEGIDHWLLSGVAAERLARWVKDFSVDPGAFSPALPPPEPPRPDVPKRLGRPPAEVIRIASMMEADLKSGRKTLEELQQAKLVYLQARYARPDQKEAAHRSVEAALLALGIERRRPQ